LLQEHKLSKKQLLKRETLCEDLHNIINNVCLTMNGRYKYLERCEPSLCSLDEQKQFRLNCDFYFGNKKTSPYIEFNQNECWNKQYFTLQELREICKHIQSELEEYLCYKIDEPELFISIYEIPATNNINS